MQSQKSPFSGFRGRWFTVFVIIFSAAFLELARGSSAPAGQAVSYDWRSTAIPGAAELLVLFENTKAEDSASPNPGTTSIPILAVLRDTLGDSDASNDRLRYVWLLTNSSPGIRERILSTVPFLYWRLGSGHVANGMPKPLLDLSRPTDPMWHRLVGNLLQLTAFDPQGMPLRAPSRAYQTNTVDYERLRIEEAISFLNRAPVGEGSGPTREEMNLLVGRLTLTKNLLGGLVDNERLDHVEESLRVRQESSEGRNWELLRNSAERAGLYFEPLQLANDKAEYAILWFPCNQKFDPSGISLDKTWKLLQIANPWGDPSFLHWQGYTQVRELNEDGALLPAGEQGVSQATFIPLAVYSLDYPRMPLLLVDFRNPFKPKRRELVQRTWDDVVSEILGLSHFANWYYYAGYAGYSFIRGRRGDANDRVERLDSYAHFRIALTMDDSLDPALKATLEHGSQDLSLNPIASSPKQELQAAQARYEALEQAAIHSHALAEQLEKDRRKELAQFGETTGASIRSQVWHILSLGTYTARRPSQDDTLTMIDHDRKIERSLKFLHAAAESGPEPEVVFGAANIQDSLFQLSALIDRATPAAIRRDAASVVERLRPQVRMEALRLECDRSLVALGAASESAAAVHDERQPSSAALPRNSASEDGETR